MNKHMPEGCPHAPYADLMPDNYAKQGIAAVVEAQASAIVADPSNMDQYFRELDDEINAAVSGKTTVTMLRRAELRRQAGEAVTTYNIGQRAMPAMTTWNREHGSLLKPDDVIFEPYKDYPYSPPEEVGHYRNAVGAGFLVQAATESFLGESKADTTHPYHRLHHYLERNWQGFVQAFMADELRRTGNNSEANKAWCSPSYTYDRLVAYSNLTTVTQGVDLMAGAAAHCILFEKELTPENLQEKMLSRLPQMRWMATLFRESGAREVKLHEGKGMLARIVPEEATNWLTTNLATATTREELVEPLKQFLVVASPDFIPTDLVSDGPLSKSGGCVGDVNISLRPEHRADHTEFFEEMGLPALGRSATFSAVTFTLATGKRQAENTFLPELQDFLART